MRGWECDSSPPELRVATAWVRRSCEPHVLATLALMVCPCVRSLPHPPPYPLPRVGVMPSAGTHSLLRSRTKGVRCGCDIVLLTSTSCSGFLPWQGGQGGIGPRTLTSTSLAAPCATLRYPVAAASPLKIPLRGRGRASTGGQCTREQQRLSEPRPTRGRGRRNAFYIVLEGL